MALHGLAINFLTQNSNFAFARYTLEEKDMYQTFDCWDALAAEPSIELNGATAQSSTDDDSLPSESRIKQVGRDTIAAACLLRASAALRTKIRSGGGDEVYEWERWLRHVLWVQNQKLAESNNGGTTQQSWQGKDFLAQEIEPASVALHKFRMGQWEEFNFLATKMTKLRKNTLISQLIFLRDVIGASASAKEAEILVLELLLRAQEHAANGDDKMLSRDLDEYLPLIERWSLWMALSRPSPMQRHARVFELLDAMENNTSPDQSSLDDVASLKEAMNEYTFGASASGKRLAAAILGRMNSYLMLKDGAHVSFDKERTVDLILPEKIKGSEWEKSWTEEQHDEWVHSLSNLALISKLKARGGKKKQGVDPTTWEAKKASYKKETWHLTRVLADLDSLSLDTTKNRQELMLFLMESIWLE